MKVAPIMMALADPITRRKSRTETGTAMDILRRLKLEHRLSSEDEIRLMTAPVDLSALCRELMEEVAGVVCTLGIRAEFSSGLAEFVVCADRARLEDMLLFLISNG